MLKEFSNPTLLDEQAILFVHPLILILKILFEFSN